MTATYTGPRPAAVYLLCVIANISLWGTGHLPAWLTAVQLGSLVGSWLLGRRPLRFLTRTTWLNVSMSVVAAITLYVRYSGATSIVSLAYFAALTQALQLIDARPRRSEFLLIGIAFTQVVLAAGLTQSIVLPVSIFVFVPTLIWALAEQSVREMERDGARREPVDVRYDLIRVTVTGSLGTFVIGAVLFFGLPRLPSNFEMPRTEAESRVTGFSQSVTLGDVGPALQDTRVVLRVEPVVGKLPERPEAYWRGLAFDHFDGMRWSISDAERVVSRQPLRGVQRRSIRLRRPFPVPSVVQRITREPFETAVLFTPDAPERIEGRFQRIERDRNGGLYLPARSRERVSYQIWTPARMPSRGALADDRAVPPRERRAGRRRPAKRYLQVPAFDPRVAEMGARMVRGQTNDFARAVALQEAFRKEGQYTDAPAPFAADVGSPLEAFLLGNLTGHCEYFASAMVVLARTQGLPARLVNGYAGGSPDPDGRFIEVAQADAHTWVEIHFERAGWIRFDPTPPDRRLQDAGEDSPVAWLQAVARNVDLWWYKRVVAYDSTDQAGARIRLRMKWLQWTDELTVSAQDQIDDLFGVSDEYALVPAILLFSGIALSGWLARNAWRARRPRGRGRQPVPAAYQRAQRALARIGLRRNASTSARTFAATVAAQLPGPGAEAFSKITDQYLAERFGLAASVDLSAELDQLDSALKAARVSRARG